jgi:hypothetical protein
MAGEGSKALDDQEHGCFEKLLELFIIMDALPQCVDTRRYYGGERYVDEYIFAS